MHSTKPNWVVLAAGVTGMCVAACSGEAGPAATESLGSAVSAAKTDAGGPAAVIASAPVDFGLTDCGATATSDAVTVGNAGTATLTVTAAVAGTAFAVSPATASVDPGGVATFTVTATVPGASQAAVVRTGRLTLTTNDKAHAHTPIPLQVTSQGATLAFAPGSAKALNLGATSEGYPADGAVDLENVGNAAAVFALGAPSGMYFSNVRPAAPQGPPNPFGGGSALATFSPAPGATQVVEAKFTPYATGKFTASAAITLVRGAVCGTSVATLKYSGFGANGGLVGWPTTPDDLPGPGVGIQANCGTSGVASFMLQNIGTKPVTVMTVTSSAGSPFTTDLTAGTVIAAQSSIDVGLFGPAVPYPGTPGPFATGALTVKTNEAGDVAHVLALSESAYGAVLAFDTSQTPGFGAFPDTQAGGVSGEALAVVNTGSPNADIELSTTGPFSAQITASTATGVDAQVTFAPTTQGPATGSVSVTSSALCQPAPAPLALSGNGTPGNFTVSPPSLFVEGLCGASSTFNIAPLTVSNQTANPVTWSATSNLTSLTLTPAGSTLAPGASVTVQVTSTPIPQFPIMPTMYGTIAFTSDASGPSPQPIAVTETGDGAYLGTPVQDIDFGSVPVGSVQTTNVSNILFLRGGGMQALELGGQPPNLQASRVMNNDFSLALDVTQSGPQSATATWINEFGSTFCTPNTFQVKANGI